MADLTQVHEGSAFDAPHVIFVHGLGGEAQATWMHNPKDHTTLWPSWIGEDVGCHVWVAGYGAALSGWTDAAMHLADLGETLFAALQVEKSLQNRRIVLVGHSLGGLVIKSGMTQAHTLGDPKRLALLERIAAVVFVGTPHQGSDLATFADMLRFLLRTNPQVANMGSNDAWLKLLNDQFRALQRKREFGVRVFFESKGVLLGRRFFGIALGKRQLIVDRYSSDPGIAGVVPTAIEGDHMEIAKPKSRKVFIHKALVKFLKDVADGPVDDPPDKNSRPELWSKSIDIPATLRSASAPLLSWPSTLADGTWLQRPELDSLTADISNELSSTHLLLGDPGCGKSSLLVRLAQEMLRADWHVLAIKADRLPPDVLNREALAQHLNFGADVGIVLRELAKSKPVLVLIDQVDALADLVVQQSARLRVLLDLVQDLSDADGIHTVISCRTFEQKHDPALRNLDATTVQLQLPEWSSVQPILAARGLAVEAWNQEIQQVLRSPHALEIFLSLLSDATELEALRSFQGLLEKQWETQVLSDATGKRRATLHHLAKLMADCEVLGLALAQVEDHYSVIQVMAAAGLLRVDQGPGRVEFRHQTLYEFVRARSFLGESGSLTETVRANQGSLRIRPQLWHALGYFRGASPEVYSAEIVRLWAADLRPHLKMLLIEFLGLQPAPMPAERRLVEQGMTDQWFLPRFIGTAAGSPGWFSALLPTHLPRLMALPVEQASALLQMLQQALQFNADAVVDLVRSHWLIDRDKDVLSWQALGSRDVAPQVGPWLDSLVLIVGRSPIADWAVGQMAGVVSAAHPDEAPRLIAAWFSSQIESARSLPATSVAEDEAAHVTESKGLLSAFEARQFHDMEAIAEAAPRAFVVELWPRVLEALQLCALEAPSVSVGYRQNSGLIFEDLDDEDARQERPLLRSLQVGMQGWADLDPDSFLEFVAANAQSELLLVHRLLAQGLKRAASHSPRSVHDYLLGDPRRLVLGPYTDVHKESVALIETVCPLLDDTSYAEMETMLRNWCYYNEVVAEDDASIRQQRLQWARQHRLRLLRALPAGRHSPALQKLVAEEERAFPNLTGKDVHFSSAQTFYIGSPVSAQQMNRAADAEVLKLFSELTDDSAWDHPRDFMKGGAIQAGREFAELAKIDLAKVLRIVRRLDPVLNEIPVACALQELVPAGLDAPAFFSLVAELEDKGFVGTRFRHDAAYAIAKAADKKAPVPDDLVDRMERWLVPTASEDPSVVVAETKEHFSSVLWGRDNRPVLPNGNYPTLAALTSACLNDEPPRLDRWLSILEQHVTRVESSSVWEAMIRREMTYLWMADRSRAETLIDRLIERAPYIVNGKGWARFVAFAFPRASAAAVRKWLTSILDGREEAHQGAGELACLRHALFPAEDWARELVGVLADGSNPAAASGVAHGVANMWHEPVRRPVVHPILLQLLQSSDERVMSALAAIFVKDGFAADVQTTELLDAIIKFPNVLKRGRAEHMPEMLVKLVVSEPELVCQVAHKLLDTAGDQMGNIATSWYLSTEWLLDIALQLQDMGPAERAAGSGLFERMLEFNMPQARDMTLDLDKRTPVGNFTRAPAPRRSRNRNRNRILKAGLQN